MKFKKFIFSISILLIFLVGCNSGYIDNPVKGNPTPKEFLKNESADIFLLNGIVYSNAQDVEWVSNLEYKLGEQIGEITKQTDKARRFKDGTANKLPVGTKLHETDGPVYIAIIDEKEIPYLKMLEG
ncbi:hypothetical protein [Metabacillus litoralis]|uniref:hypothetical protein n=1 Tax=Metabacillus litoralis TaxID=152268 RepID=UPI001CFC5C60|nr:hypothetical protein [Metabacillus litoralis]